MDLSIVVVNYNTDELTKDAIASVIKNTTTISYEIIVVDNSSTKSSLNFDEYKNIKLFLNIENKGFGNACNFGASKSSGKYIMFLNSDTLVKANAIEKSIGYIKKHNNIGVLGLKTIFKDGNIDNGCKRGFPTPMASLYYFLGLDKRHPENKKYGVYHQTFIDENKNSEVDAVSGSCMIIPRTVFDEINGFDEDFFMYGEDLDICYRIKQKGYKIIYFADAEIIHLKGQSGLNKKSKKTIEHFYNAMNIFYDKHYKQKYNFLTNLIVKAGIKFKKSIG